MKSRMPGQGTSEIEVSHIDMHGFWLCVKDREYFLSFNDFPWFKDAKISQILKVELLHQQHLHWPDLDVDLELANLENPQKYPLIYE